MAKRSAGSNILTSDTGAVFDPSLFRKQHDKVLIIGFAPHHVKAPIADEGYDVWVLNELYTIRPELKERVEKSGVWFQMHGYEPPTVRDPNQREWLANLKAPVVMWWKHPGVPNSVPYPIDYVENHFFGGQPCSYFTNSVSYMLALAILLHYKTISVFGVDMAQSQEWSAQRPSCEFFLGWALAAGIKVVMPFESDLLKSWHRYGLDATDPYIAKMQARAVELEGRRNEIKAEIDKRQAEKAQLNKRISDLNAREHQIIGAQHMLEVNPKPTPEQLQKAREEVHGELQQIAERQKVLDNEIGGLNAHDHQIIGAMSDNEYMQKLGPPRQWEPPPEPPTLVPIEAQIRKWCPQACGMTATATATVTTTEQTATEGEEPHA